MHKPNSLAFHWNKLVENCNFLGFCSGTAEDSVLLGYDTTTIRNQTLMLRSNIVTHLQGSKCPKRNGHFDMDNKMDMSVLGVRMLHCCISWCLKMRTLGCFELAGSSHLFTQYRFPKEWNAQSKTDRKRVTS